MGSNPIAESRYKDHVRARRRKFREKVQALKESHPCTDCGVFYPFYVMQYDHRDPSTKEFCIASAVSRFNLERALKEIEKCDLVCANCHAVRTYNRTKRVQSDDVPGIKRPRKQKLDPVTRVVRQRQHGTLSGYMKCPKPRCEPCLKAMRDWKNGRNAEIRAAKLLLLRMTT